MPNNVDRAISRPRGVGAEVLPAKALVAKFVTVPLAVVDHTPLDLIEKLASPIMQAREATWPHTQYRTIRRPERLRLAPVLVYAPAIVEFVLVFRRPQEARHQHDGNAVRRAVMHGMATSWHVSSTRVLRHLPRYGFSGGTAEVQESLLTNLRMFKCKA